MRVKKLNNVDEVVFKLLADCGNAKTETLRSIGLSQTRLESYKRDGLLRSVSCDSRYAHKNKESVWGITEKGRAFIKENYGLTANNSITAVKHNARVAEGYADMINAGANIDRLYGERDTRKLVEDKLEYLKVNDFPSYLEWNERYERKSLSMPDFTYYVPEEGIIYCYEVTTNHYGQAEIDAKELTATLLDAVICEVNVLV